MTPVSFLAVLPTSTMRVVAGAAFFLLGFANAWISSSIHNPTTAPTMTTTMMTMRYANPTGLPTLPPQSHKARRDGSPYCCCRRRHQRRRPQYSPHSGISPLWVGSMMDASSLSGGISDGEDDEEWEEVEYEYLSEAEFMNSEWLIGSVMDRNPNKIQETWVRLATDRDGKNVAIWGDNSQGTWSFDASNQFLSMSKESIFGKAIWAGVVDDFYYTIGTIRGYNWWSAAAVLGQWQAKRLGVEEGEAGIAPWFQEDQQQEEEEEDDATTRPRKSGTTTKGDPITLTMNAEEVDSDIAP